MREGRNLSYRYALRGRIEAEGGECVLLRAKLAEIRDRETDPLSEHQYAMQGWAMPDASVPVHTMAYLFYGDYIRGDTLELVLATIEELLGLGLKVRGSFNAEGHGGEVCYRYVIVDDVITRYDDVRLVPEGAFPEDE